MAILCSQLRQELQLKNFGFSGVPDRLFAIPQARWYFQPYSWLFYRFAVAIYAIVWFFVIISFWGDPPHYAKQADTKAKWFIYVSNWSYGFLCLYLLTASIVTLKYHIETTFKASSITRGVTPVNNTAPQESIELVAQHGKTTKDTAMLGNHNNGFQRDDCQDDKLRSTRCQDNKEVEVKKSADDAESPPTMPNDASLSWYFKVTWFLQNVSFAAALFVVILFWGIDFDPATSNATVFNVHIHGVNLLIVLVDLFLIATPYRLLHLIYPCSMSLIYYLFTIVYYLCGGMNEYPPDETYGNTYIYKDTLDWDRNVTTTAVIMTLVVMVAVPLIHLLFFGFYHIRRVSGSCCNCCDGVPPQYVSE